MEIFRVMNSLMKKNIFLVLLSIFLGVITVLANVGLISNSAVLITRAAGHPDVLDLMVLIVGVRFFGISRGVFRYFERLISHNTTLKILSALRSWVYKRFNDSYSENNINFKAGEIYTRIVNDVDVIKDFFLRGFFPALTAVLIGILTMIFISFFSVRISVIYILFYFLCAFVLPIVFFSISRKLTLKESDLKKNMNIKLLDLFKGITEVSIYNIQEDAIIDFETHSNELLKIQKTRNIIEELKDNLTSFMLSILIVITLILTRHMLMLHKILPIYYSMLPLTIMTSFEALAPMSLAVYKFYDVYNSGKNILDIIGNKDRAKESKNKDITDFDLKISGISIKAKDRILVRNFSLELPYKKKIAIVGMNGSGKSTLLRCLLGFVKNYEGVITIGGEKYENLEIDRVRECFTYVEQKPYIFNASIKENLLIANTLASDEEINGFLNKLEVSKLIEQLPDKLDTQIGQYGYNFSGGEVERLIIARALLKDSKIILLDEPTANLDMMLEKEVVQQIQNLIEDKSCIWVTHKLTNMEWMDEIVVLDKGEIAEKGTHQELIERKGMYYNLWNAQKKFVFN